MKRALLSLALVLMLANVSRGQETPTTQPATAGVVGSDPIIQEIAFGVRVIALGVGMMCGILMWRNIVLAKNQRNLW